MLVSAGECGARPRTRARRPPPASCRHRAGRGSPLRAIRRPGYAPSVRRSAPAAVRDATGSSPPSATVASRTGSTPNGGLEHRASRRPQERPLGQRLAHVPPGVERSDDLPGHVLLHRDEWIVGGHGLAILAHLSGHGGDRRHHRIGVGEQLVLQPQRMQAAASTPPRASSRAREPTAAQMCDRARD